MYKNFSGMAAPNLVGKVAIITGSSSGIGAGTAIHFAKLGAKVVLSGRNEQALIDVKKHCVQASGKEKDTVYVCGEITDPNIRKALVQSAIDNFGQLDCLVNNAGICPVTNVCDASGSLATFDKIFDTNIKAVIELCQLSVPHLIKTKGSIVNISSVGGLKPVPGFTYYCMSKCALDHFTRCLAQELAPHGVRVNGINPGGVRSQLYRSLGIPVDKEQIDKHHDELGKKTHPLGRIGEPEDIAQAIAFLSSGQSSWITGTTMKVDGGYMIRSESILGDVGKETEKL